jgi:predicted metal-dependent enzyme (double-stranded beta helix superfamily)
MFDVDEFITDCRAALVEKQAPTAVKEVVERALSRPEQIDAALGEPERAGISTLHRSDDLTVLWVVWPPHAALYPHDHRMWAANGIYGGREDNVFYRRGPDGIARSGAKAIDRGEVALLGSEVIHSVANPHSSYTAAVHVYGGDFFATPRSQWDPDSLVEQPFDVEQVRRLLVAADEAAKRNVEP